MVDFPPVTTSILLTNASGIWLISASAWPSKGVPGERRFPSINSKVLSPPKDLKLTDAVPVEKPDCSAELLGAIWGSLDK